MIMICLGNDLGSQHRLVKASTVDINLLRERFENKERDEILNRD